MKNLIAILDYYCNACHRATDYPTRRTFFDQATGAVQMYCLLNIKNESKVVALWDNIYRPKFEAIVYPATTEVVQRIDHSEWRKNPGNAFI